MSVMSMTSSFAQRYYALINLFIFKLSWVLLVFGQTSGIWPALLLLLVSLVLHPAPQSALRSGGVVALCGIVLDQILTSTGVFIFSSAHAPGWLLVLWLHFGHVLPHGFGFMFRLPLWLQATAGAAGGTLSYWTGMLTGAVGFGTTTTSTLLVLAVIWAVFVPSMIRLAGVSANGIQRSKPAAVLLLLLFFVSTVHQPGAHANDASMIPVGRATYRFLLMDIYEAKFAAASSEFLFPHTVPFELGLTYKRNFRSQALVAETVKQWRLQGIEPQADWISSLETIIPDVAAGDSLALFVDANYTSHFSLNNKLIGVIADPAFTKAFAGIWLADNTTRPEFRQQLLRGQP